MVERRVNMIWSADRPGAEGEIHLPPADVYELKDAVVIELELPGALKEEIEVYIIGNRLSISGVKRDRALSRESEAQKVSYLQIERKFGRFARKFELLTAVNTGAVRASFQQGILSITLPKIEDKRGKRRRIVVE